MENLWIIRWVLSSSVGSKMHFKMHEVLKDLFKKDQTIEDGKLETSMVSKFLSAGYVSK